MSSLDRRDRKTWLFARCLGCLLVASMMSPAYVDPVWADRAQAKYWFDKGVALEDEGHADDALTCYERAIDADIDYTAAYQRATRLWMQQEAFDRAITHLERFTLRHPDHPFAWYALAYAYRRSARWEHAVLAYESYVDLRPGEATPYFGLGVARLENGDRDGARAAFERYVALEQDPGRARFVEQARRELAALDPAKTKTETNTKTNTNTKTKTPTPSGVTEDRAAHPRSARPKTPPDTRDKHDPLAPIVRLMTEHRYTDAEALASRTRAVDDHQALELLLLRAKIASALGDRARARELLWAVLAAAPTYLAVYRMAMAQE